MTLNVFVDIMIFNHLDTPKILSSPTKRYVSSFKTLANSTNGKQAQRINHLKDSVVILKLPKERKIIMVN